MDEPGKSKKRLVLWMVVTVAVLGLTGAVLTVLVFLKPSHYRPARLSYDEREVAAKQFFRRMMDFDDLAQSNAPFEFVITAEQINRSLASADEIAAMVPGGRSGRVQEIMAAADLCEPAVAIREGKLTLMVGSDRFGVVVSGDLAPAMDDRGRLVVPLTAVRVGRLPVLEGLVRHQITRTRDRLGALHAAHLADKNVPGSDVTIDLASLAANYSARMVLAALDGKPIVPEGSYRHRRIRLVGIELNDDKVTVHVIPVPPRRAGAQPASSQTSIQSSPATGRSR